MPHVAGEAFFSEQIGVVLRDGPLIHGRAEIRGIGEILGVSVVDEKGEAVGEAPPRVYPASLVPASRRVFQQVDPRHRERGADHAEVGWKHGAREEADLRERPAWPDGTRSGRRVVDQVRALQVETAGALVAYFDHGLGGQRLLNGKAPLLDVLRGAVGIGGREADRRLAQRRGAKVKPGEAGNEVVALAGL